MKINPLVEEIKRICFDRNITQAKLSEMTGYTQVSICRWFSGQRTPTIDAVEKMADAVGMNLLMVCDASEKKTNGDFIRSMNDQQLSAFLFIGGLNTLSGFLECGGKEIMNMKELREWIKSDNFKCRQTVIGKEFLLNDDFTLKKEEQG